MILWYILCMSAKHTFRQKNITERILGWFTNPSFTDVLLACWHMLAFMIYAGFLTYALGIPQKIIHFSGILFVSYIYIYKPSILGILIDGTPHIFSLQITVNRVYHHTVPKNCYWGLAFHRLRREDNRKRTKVWPVWVQNGWKNVGVSELVDAHQTTPQYNIVIVLGKRSW